MPINAHPEYFKAEEKYLQAKTVDEKVFWLEEMIKLAPKHKSSEKFLVELRTRLRKFQEKSEKLKKKSKGKKGIRKEGFQFVLVGFTNRGKSALLARLTNAQPRVAEHEFTTTFSELGTFGYEGVKAQIVDTPSLGSDYFDIGLVNNADCLIFVVTSLDEIAQIEEKIPRARGKRIVAVNKIDNLTESELKKLEAQIRSRRINGVAVSAKTGLNIEELKKEMFRQMDMIRVYMKEPGKAASPIPMVLKKDSTVKDVAEHILKGFSAKVKETRITGPSGKFPNQKVGLSHVLKDRDTIEFHTR